MEIVLLVDFCHDFDCIAVKEAGLLEQANAGISKFLGMTNELLLFYFIYIFDCSAVKEAGLLEQAVAIIQEVVNGQIYLEFRSIQNFALNRLSSLYSNLPKDERGGEGRSVHASIS